MKIKDRGEKLNHDMGFAGGERKKIWGGLHGIQQGKGQ